MTDSQPHLLITGGAGYIGSHMCVESLQAGYDVTVVDNLTNSSRKSIDAVQRITQKTLRFIEGDIRDQALLTELMSRQSFAGVVHFAGLKAVGESTEQPLRYWDNNVTGTARLIQAMQDTGHNTLVFSSSATVYGAAEQMPLCEDNPTGALNPYGQTKLTVEHLLRDVHASSEGWRVSILRYFNPVGAHQSGEIGEDPNDIPNNLMPFVSQVAVGRRPQLSVFGNDYDTPDGTGVRDYIHVVDLVRGHLKALEFLSSNPGLHVHNLGTGRGNSVLEVVKAFETASGQAVPYQIAERRAGDAAVSYADPAKAAKDLGWQAEYDLDAMCRDAWRWQSKYPQGYSRDD